MINYFYSNILSIIIIILLLTIFEILFFFFNFQKNVQKELKINFKNTINTEIVKNYQKIIKWNQMESNGVILVLKQIFNRTKKLEKNENEEINNKFLVINAFFLFTIVLISLFIIVYFIRDYQLKKKIKQFKSCIDMNIIYIIIITFTLIGLFQIYFFYNVGINYKGMSNDEIKDYFINAFK